MSVLEVQEAPENKHDEINNGNAAVEWKFSDLSCRELSVGISEGDNSIVFYAALQRQCCNTVVARLDEQLFIAAPDRVLDGFGLIKMNCGRSNVVPGVGVGVVG